MNTPERSSDEAAHNIAFVDELTGLPNRRQLNENLLDAAEQHPGSFGVIVIDLDGLKHKNDTEGHDAGDEYIKKAAQTLQANIRSGEDARDADAPAMGRPEDKRRAHSSASRMGGDEFIVVILGTPDVESINAVKDRLQQALENDGIQASCGAAQHTESQPIEEVLRNADQEMYADKRTRKREALSERQIQAVRTIGRIVSEHQLPLGDIPGLLRFLGEVEN